MRCRNSQLPCGLSTTLRCHPERHTSLGVGAVRAVGVNREASPGPSFWECKHAGTAWACDYNNLIIKTTHSTSRMQFIQTLFSFFSRGGAWVHGYVSIANDAQCNTNMNQVAPKLRNRPRKSCCDRGFALTCFEGGLYTDLCALSPVLTEHFASNAENFVLNLEGSKKLHYYSSEVL